MKKITTEEIKTGILDIIEDKLVIDKSSIEDDSVLTSDLGADSLDSVELVMELEKKFDISISDDVAMKVVTVNDMIELVEKILNK